MRRSLWIILPALLLASMVFPVANGCGIGDEENAIATLRSLGINY